MSNVKIVVRRVTGMLAVLVATSFVVYSALYVAPGEPIDTLAGGRQLAPEAREALVQEYNLDEPFIQRYVSWLGGVVHGDFGTSVVSQGQDVGDLLAPRIGTTALLVAMSATLIILLGVAAALVAGLKRGVPGTLVTVLATVGLAIPSFVAAVALIAVFAVGLGWFPVFGPGDGFADQLWHLTLPAFALALANVAYVARIGETAIAREAASEHVLTATGRGIPRGSIIRRHILRNAALPIWTTAGLITAYLVVGSAVVETAFALDGLGSYLVQAVARSDFAVVQAISLIVIVAFLGINLLVDLFYVRLDPRLARSGS